MENNMDELYEEGKEQNLVQEKEVAVSSKSPKEQLDECIDELVMFGGYELIESVVDGAKNLNPEKRARRDMFLTESSSKQERKELKKKLQMWSELLSSGKDLVSLVEGCEEKSQIAEKTLNENLRKAIKETRDLERSYRAMALFFKNTEKDKIKNLTIMNASLEQVKDLDDTRFFEAVAQEFKDAYDRLDLRENYSLLVLPGYLGSNKVVEKWAKMVHENKVMMITDFQHLDAADDVMELFEAANLTGGDVYRSNTMMTCNWLVGRDKHADLGEEEELYVPPSSSLAGVIYSKLMSQVAAGKKHGGLSEVDGVKFPLKKSEIENLEKLQLVPMVKEYEKVMSFGGKTLFNGDNIGLQIYSVVRVFDWTTKVLIDFLNRRAFENIDFETKRELKRQIAEFLDKIKGPGKYIEDFEIRRFEQDPKQKDRVYIDIHLTPYFPAKNFVLKLDGHKGDNGNEWKSDVEQV